MILALDWVDLAGALRAALGCERAEGQDHQCQRRLPHPQRLEHGLRDPAAGRSAAADDARRGGAAAPRRARRRQGAQARGGAGQRPRATSRPTAPLRVDDLARSLKAAVGDREVTLTHLPLSWNGATWPFRHPLDYIGSEGGGGVGGGPAFRSARRSRSRARDGCRSPSAATATSAWARPRSGPRCITEFRSSSWSATIARSSTTNCTRSASPASAIGRSRTAGSASASPIPTSTARRWGRRKARSVSTRSPRRAISCRHSRRRSRRSKRPGGGGRCAGRARLFGGRDRGDAARNGEGLRPRAAAKSKSARPRRGES